MKKEKKKDKSFLKKNLKNDLNRPKILKNGEKSMKTMVGN